jgi:hypothetical protein
MRNKDCKFCSDVTLRINQKVVEGKTTREEILLGDIFGENVYK